MDQIRETWEILEKQNTDWYGAVFSGLEAKEGLLEVGVLVVGDHG